MRLWIAITAFLFIGCQLPGTGTGNPFNDHQASNQINTAIDRVVTDICFLIRTCHGDLAFSNCYAGVSTLTSYAERLGVFTEPAPSVKALSESELKGQLVPNLEAERACRLEIRGLRCDDTKVVNAYLPSTSEQYAGTAELLLPVCGGVFGSDANRE